MKKILSMVLALALVLALSITAFAVEYDFADETVPAEWEQHWGAKQFSIVDGTLYVERVEGNNSYFAAGFNAGDFKAGVGYTVKVDIWFGDDEYGPAIMHAYLAQDNFDGTIYAEAQQSLTAGEVATLSFTFTPETDLSNVWFATRQNEWKEQGVSYYVDNVSITEGIEETPAVEETPAEDTEVEAPAEDTEVEAPVEDTTTEAPAEDEPAETGLALAVVPAIVALAAVAVSKKR